MSPLDANLTALERYHPALAAQIRSQDSADQGEWLASREGVPTVRRRGALWASAFYPSQEAARAVPVWDAADFIVLSSIGAGYLAEAVTIRYPEWPVVVVESDPAWFAEVLRHRDLSSLLAHPRLTVLLGPDGGALGEFLSRYSCRRVELLHWRPSAEASPEWTQALADQIAQAQAQARVNVATYRRFADLWARNLRRNEAQGEPVLSLASLADCHRGHPAVIAAAGPSLADSLAWMRRHRAGFVLIAVDTAWSALAAHNLSPDFLVVMDGQYWNARHLDRPLPAQTKVVTEWIGPPRAFRIAPGRTYLAASSVPFLRQRERALWGPLPSLASGGSVATVAWSLALHLGCQEVAFAGLDLGFPRGQTHVPGSQFEEAIQRRARRLVPAETTGLQLRGLDGLASRPAVDGGTVLSDSRMDLFRSWLASAVRAQPMVRVFNLSTRGSVIPGLEAPPPHYGEAWPPLPAVPCQGQPLTRQSLSNHSWAGGEALEAALRPEANPADVEAAWTSGQGVWGAEVWGAWAGRAYATWRRWPSPQSLAAVREVLALAQDWARFF